MKTKTLVFIRGDWEGGNNGRYPILCQLATEANERPILMSEGWGHGLGGSSFSFTEFVKKEFIEDLNRSESVWLYRAILHVTSTGLNASDSKNYILNELAGNEPVIPEELHKYLGRHNKSE